MKIGSFLRTGALSLVLSAAACAPMVAGDDSAATANLGKEQSMLAVATYVKKGATKATDIPDGVSIAIKANDSTVMRCTVREGSFQIKGLPSGTYQVEVLFAEPGTEDYYSASSKITWPSESSDIDLVAKYDDSVHGKQASAN